MSGDLPRGWARVKLNDLLLRVEAGKSFKCEPRRANPDEWGVIKVSAMTWGEFDEAENKAVPENYGFDSRNEIQSGDILVSRANTEEYVGAPVLVGECRPRLLLSDKSLRLIPGSEVDRRWLLYSLSSPGVRREISRRSTGTKESMRNISQGSLGEVSLLVPPAAEQLRIVDSLEEQLSRLDHASATLTRAERNLGSLAKAGLYNLLGEHEQVALHEVLAEGLSNGRSVTTRDGGFPVLRLTALGNGRVDLTQRKSGDWDEDQAMPFLVSRGDFLISRGSGSISLVGRGALVESDPDPVAYPDTIIRARPNPKRILPSFLRIIWNSDIVRKQIERQARTTAGIYKVNQKILSAVSFPLPNLDGQRRFCRQYEDLEWKMAKLSVEVQISQARTKSLRRALLAEAFNGRLVPQNSSDEPAESLLHRIATERGSGKRRPSGLSRSRMAASADPSQARPKEPAPAAIVPVGSVSQTFLDLEIPE
ncbi:hypothetical protein ACIQGZ_01690 [Streptomyces sp. NPDC092296]|uniref:restriction endonuclease subunit S n=1 Tax=Streptomyces sp. NPDC092296 TaxID=3366012 RepID=UPI003802FBB6